MTLFRLSVNISGQVYQYYTQAPWESAARRNVARKLERRLGLIHGALTPKLLSNSDSVKVEEVKNGTSQT